MRQPLREAVHFARGHAEGFCHFAHGEPSVHGDEAANHCYAGGLPPPRSHAFRAPVLVDVVEQLIAARAANVNVNVRAIAALLVQETLEVESPAQRAYARNPEAIGDHGTGGGSTRDCGNAAAAGFLDDV